MKACGIVVEYNPFHNGHRYHALEAKKKTNSDLVIAVMSGNFVQRGEPAIVSKWERTKMALLNGCDLVIELPYAFATQKAENFAYGAVKLLDAIGCHSLVFGSENGKIDSFLQTSEILLNCKEQLDQYVKKHIKTGVTYARAFQMALEDLHLDNELNLALPNNILGLEYVKAVQKYAPSMEVHTILRLHANYHDEQINDSSIASATAIRKLLQCADNAINKVMPNGNLQIIEDFIETNGTLLTWEHYFPYLKHKILTSSPEELKAIYEVEEGIEYRLIEKIKLASSFEQFISTIKSKRYTHVKLQRMCVHILLNSKKEQLKNVEPSYIRLLGMNDTGKKYLNQKKKQILLPIVSRAASSKDPLLQLDIKASNIYALGLPIEKQEKFIHREYSQIPIQV